jgi:predicted transcriptional regulator
MYVRMNVIMSIRPTFCKLILDGQKRYEYRKRVFNRSDVDKVYIYASKPISKVVGYFTIKRIICDSPSMVWDMTHREGGIKKKQFNDYFKGRNLAHAIEIDEVVKFDTPIDPREVIKDFTAPQNFTYTEIDLKTFT